MEHTSFGHKNKKLESMLLEKFSRVEFEKDLMGGAIMVCCVQMNNRLILVYITGILIGISYGLQGPLLANFCKKCNWRIVCRSWSN